MKKVRSFLLKGVSAIMMLGTPAVAQQQPQKPNVIFILADNVGYGDLGPYGGGEMRGAATPQIALRANDHETSESEEFSLGA